MHVNTTFQLLVNGVQSVISDHDYEMQAVLDDYVDYCYSDKLITDGWKKMRMQLAGTTFDFNIAENVYYDNINRGFSAHDYLSLYKQKSIRAVRKITAIITAILKDGKMEYVVERGELTTDRIQIIEKAIEDGKKYGYVLDSERYFFVEKFYRTDFQKKTPGAPMGSRMFDLTEILNTEKLPDIKIIAEFLKKETWS